MNNGYYTQNMGYYKSVGMNEVKEIARRNRLALIILQNQLGVDAEITPEMISTLAKKLK